MRAPTKMHSELTYAYAAIFPWLIPLPEYSRETPLWLQSGGVVVKTTFRGYQEPLTHAASQAACRTRHGGELARLDFSGGDLEAVRHLLSRGELRNFLFFRKSLWVGSAVSSEEALPFFWGSSAEPSVPTGCLLLSADTLHLQAQNCTQLHGFVCMWEEWAGDGPSITVHQQPSNRCIT